MLCAKCGAENQAGSGSVELWRPAGKSMRAMHAEIRPRRNSAEIAAVHSPRPGRSSRTFDATNVGLPNIRVTPEQPDASATLDGDRKTVTALSLTSGLDRADGGTRSRRGAAIIDPALRNHDTRSSDYDGYVVAIDGDGISLVRAPAHSRIIRSAALCRLQMQRELSEPGSVAGNGHASLKQESRTLAKWWSARSRPAGASSTPDRAHGDLASRLQTIGRGLYRMERT